jgi:hypothetical protein
MNDQYFVPSGSFIDLSEHSSNLGTLTSGSGLLQCPTCGKMTGTIDVQFKKAGAVYRYYHAPPALWEFLLNGKKNMKKHDKFSIGVAFHNEVISKKDIYHYERIA